VSPDQSVISPTQKSNTFDKRDNLLDSKQIANKNITSKKIFFYKNLIRYIDILVSLLILIGCILSQIEDELFYKGNLQDRVGVVKLMRYIQQKGMPKDLSYFNISYLNNTAIMSKVNLTDIETIPLELVIDNTNANIRYILTILTIFCVPLIAFGRYIEYLREEIYKRKLESKIKLI
jgi:hypothetical protein